MHEGHISSSNSIFGGGFVSTPSSTGEGALGAWKIFDDFSGQGLDRPKSSGFRAITSSLWSDVHYIPIDACITSSEVREALATIRHEFSLSTVELAKVLKVSRQTVYDWSSCSSSVNASNRLRISEVLKIANSWKSRELGPVGAMVRESINGFSLVAELMADELNHSVLDELFGDLEEKVEQAKSQSRMPSVSELSERFPRARLTPREHQRNLKASSIIK